MNSHKFVAPLFIFGALVLAAACGSSSSTGATGAACHDDTECDSGDACDPVSGVCIVASDSMDVAVGGACLDDGDCEAGDFCADSGECEADPGTSDGASGADCGADSECSSGVCDVLTDTCT